MADIPISKALLLWNHTLLGGEPAFAVRRLGHGDYDRFDCQNGACFASWQNADTAWQNRQLLIECWHASAFYGVPIEMIHAELMAIPEYRDMIALDCLPEEYQRERLEA